MVQKTAMQVLAYTPYTGDLVPLYVEAGGLMHRLSWLPMGGMQLCCNEVWDAWMKGKARTEEATVTCIACLST